MELVIIIAMVIVFAAVALIFVANSRRDVDYYLTRGGTSVRAEDLKLQRAR